MTSIYRKRMILLSACALFMCICIIAVGFPVSAEKKAKKILTDNELPIESIDLTNNNLVIELISTGEKRCTIEDIDALMKTFNTIAYSDLKDSINQVTVRFTNKNGDVIYDYTVSDWHIADTIKLKANSAAAEIVTKISNGIVMPDSCNVKNCIVDKTPTTSRVNLSLECDLASVSIADMTSNVFEQIQKLVSDLSEVNECAIQVRDAQNSEILCYMIGNYDTGIRVAWLSPSIVSQFGPPSE